LVSCAFAAHSQFTSGNLVVSYNVGNTSAGIYRTLSLQEFTTGTTGTLNSAMAVGAAISTARITDDRRFAWEGQINTSADGKYIVLAGRDAADGTAAAAARAASLSVVRIPKAKVIEYTDFPAASTAFNANSTRSATSVNGNTIFVSTALSTADTGIRVVTFGDNTATNSYLASQTRSVSIWGNEFVAMGVPASGPASFITGVATAPDTAPTETAFPVLTLPAVNDNLIGAVLFDVDLVEAGNDLMYVVQRNKGINKYSKTGGVWTFISSTTPGDAYIGGFIGFVEMTGRVEGGKPVLYAIKSDGAAAPAGFKSNLYQIIVNTLRTGDWNIAGGFPTQTVIATATEGTAQTFRGVTFAPIATLSTNSFDQQKAKVLLVYPSPDKTVLNVSNNNEAISVDVYNVLGQKVLSSKSQGDLRLNISGLNAGFYIVRASSGETARFVK